MKKYHIGILMGVFDMFHIGHLKLIRNANNYCDYLRVCVLSDELVYKFKQKYPVIPLEERMEILAAITGVDEVVAITDDPSRLIEYKRRPFDCFFSGDDYRGNEYWEYERMYCQHVMEPDYGLPCMGIEKEYVNTSVGQLRTRFQAFVEALEIKKLAKEG